MSWVNFSIAIFIGILVSDVSLAQDLKRSTYFCVDANDKVIECTAEEYDEYSKSGSERGQAKICNQSTYDMTFAYVEVDSDAKEVESKGWYNLEPGECQSRTLWEHIGYTSYVYAHISGRLDVYFDGDHEFCISTDFDAFEFTHRLGAACSQGALRPVSKLSDGLIYPFKYEWELPPLRKDGADSDDVLLGALMLGGLLALGAGIDANDKAEEEACMRKCTKSSARCLELCTQ